MRRRYMLSSAAIRRVRSLSTSLASDLPTMLTSFRGQRKLIRLNCCHDVEQQPIDRRAD